jgi:hypothetical protein
MPISTEELEIGKATPDHTPSCTYHVRLSGRDVEALKSLKGRNGAGIDNLQIENIALWKMINQVCDFESDDSLDNYD